MNIRTMKNAGAYESSDIDLLYAACEAADLCAVLERETALNAERDLRGLFLAYEGTVLLGALSIFAPRFDEAEISALVLPSARRRGVFTALLAEAEKELARFGYRDELFLLDERSASGRAVVAAIGGRYDFSEYAMVHSGPPPAFDGRGLVLRRLLIEDIAELVELRKGEFGDSREETESFERASLSSANREARGAFLEGRLVAACSICDEGERVSLNGLVVDAALRGQGLGRAFLSAILVSLSADGRKIVLDVNSRNEAAYALYTKLGFVAEQTIEYYRRKLV